MQPTLHFRKKLATEIKKLKCPALFENVLWVAFFILSGPFLLVNNPVFVESLCALLFFLSNKVSRDGF
jgi:hypothetical protein